MKRLKVFFRRIPNGAFLILLSLALMVGIAARVKIYRDYRSLSFDEACLANNILERSYSGLLQPLSEDQGAPLGFLFLMKAMTQIFGESEDALRSLPLISGLVALPLFYGLSYLLLGPQGSPFKRPAFWTSIVLFTLHPAIVHYAVEVKQYSSDVLVSIILLTCGIIFLRSSRHFWQIIALSLIGLITIPFSHPAVFILGGIGLTWFLSELEKYRAKTTSLRSFLGASLKMTLPAFLWTGCFAGIYIYFLAGLQQNNHLLSYWQAGFAPWPLLHPEDFLWYINRPGSMFESLSSNPFTAIAVLFMLVGIVLWPKKSVVPAGLFIFPALLNLLAAVVKSYPFSSRLILYLVPAAILLTAMGIDQVASFLPRRQAWFLTGLALLFLSAYPFAMLFDSSLRGMADQNIRGVITYLLKNWQGEDKIYVYYDSRCQFRYYARQMGISPADYAIGSPEIQNRFALHDWKSAVRADLEPYLGRPRTWFVFSNYSYLDLPGALEILDQTGKQVSGIRKNGASGYLYDLSR